MEKAVGRPPGKRDTRPRRNSLTIIILELLAHMEPCEVARQLDISRQAVYQARQRQQSSATAA